MVFLKNRGKSMSKRQFEENKRIAAEVAKAADRILAGESITAQNADWLMGYSGSGGLANAGARGRGLLFEYYTPYAICETMWSLVYKHGFKSGRILEPSCGIGRLLRYIDPTANTVDAFEFSKDDNTSFLIAKACFPWVNFTNDYFESIFYIDNRRVTVEPTYDLVIGNPPYGDFSGFYAGQKREGSRFPGNTYDQYFIWAGLQVLKPGGLLCYIVPSTFLQNNGSYNTFKTWVAENAELLEAYRMPTGVFEFTEIMTDIIVFKKK